MIKKLSLIGLCLLLGYTVQADLEAADSDDLSAAINYLLAFVAESDCTFFRNDRAHTAEEAVTHMQRKYDHFKNKIKTPEDFIRLAATKSLLSGKPYMVKTKVGRLLKFETWLLEALEAYRQGQRGKTANQHRQQSKQ
ncbi:hypothetical protein D1AOALGA4SA_10931 [Olavius algarvensis Delta 1 endosymbiont]|nr:hypothetical protein D1AOALGA4SA_10931 [Olavius algarvensis Delta 1 endosymbiont]